MFNFQEFFEKNNIPKKTSDKYMAKYFPHIHGRTSSEDKWGMYDSGRNLIFTIKSSDITDNPDEYELINCSGYGSDLIKAYKEYAKDANFIAICKCGNKNEFAVANQPDGSYLCYNCRS